MGINPPTPDHVVAAMQRDINDGFTANEVASRNGIHRSLIGRLARKGRLLTTPVFHRPGNKIGIANGGEFPRWLPRDLRSDYHDNTRLYGEEHAARLARVAKAEAMRPEA